MIEYCQRSMLKQNLFGADIIMDYFNYTNDSEHSYYERQNQSPYRPRNNHFGMASCICGIIAMATMCTGILPLITGSLSIIFAVMGHRKGRRMESTSLAGIAFSSVALLFVGFILFYSFKVLPVLLQDETFHKQMSYMYESMYGEDFDSFIEQYYDLDLPQENEADS